MLRLLKEPSLAGLAVGSPEFFRVQKRLIRERPLLKSCYDAWYGNLLKDAASVPGDGLVLELGSGGSTLEQYDNTIVTSDVVPGVAERVIDARSLPFEDGSLKAIVLSHVFHHIPDVELFLREASRVLVDDGVISMIEVAHTPFARLFFQHFHPEPYEDEATTWSFGQADSMMDSNQALSWMVFERDRLEMASKFPEFEVSAPQFLPWLSYLLSGGVTMRELVPRAFAPLVLWGDRVVRPLDGLFALHWHICIRKKKSGAMNSGRGGK